MNLLYYDWDWSILWRYYPVFLKGIFVTLEITILSILFGSFIGILLGVFLSKHTIYLRSEKRIVFSFIDIIRSLPLLILILLFNYYFSFLTNIKSPFWLSVMALSLNLSAFVADVLRGAIDGVPKTLIEAGYALGMNQKLVLRRIILPEAIRAIIPSLALLYIDILKLSSLASMIAVNEVVHVSAEISTITFRYLEVFAILAIIYLLLVMPFSYLARKIERTRWFLRRS